MNRFLADTLSGLNSIIAILIVIGATVVGYGNGAAGGLGLVGAAVGLIAGIVLASLCCGIIAYLTLIEGHLAYLSRCADHQNEMAKITVEAIDGLHRKETTVTRAG